jgi:DNA-directed RNA polymerase subunit RPC12/RpoP
MKSYEKRLECWQCLRCDHLWSKRPGDRPVNCPGCHSKLWSVTPTRAKGGGRKKKEDIPEGV